MTRLFFKTLAEVATVMTPPIIFMVWLLAVVLAGGAVAKSLGGATGSAAMMLIGLIGVAIAVAAIKTALRLAGVPEE